MFDNFPKKRFSLSSEYKNIYDEHYKSNRQGTTAASSLSRKMENWLHYSVAKDRSSDIKEKTLEIGAGTLNQLDFEENTGQYDIIEPFKLLYQDSPNLTKINNIYSDIEDIIKKFNFIENNQINVEVLPYGFYDRIISSAVLEHILDLPLLVAHSCLLLKDNGVFSASIPSQRRFLWTMAYRLTTGLEFRLKYKLDYDVIMNYEHVNTQQEIIDVCTYFFGKTDKKLFGITDELSLYTHLSCRKPNKNNAIEFINSRLKQE